jgi:hypothetical protein
MADQGNLFSAQGESSPGAPSGRPASEPRTIPRGLVILERVLYVIVRLYLGVLVALLPWFSMPIANIWVMHWPTDAWIVHWPKLATFLAHGWVRGLVSGIGLLNIWIALRVLFHPARRQ